MTSITRKSPGLESKSEGWCLILVAGHGGKQDCSLRGVSREVGDNVTISAISSALHASTTSQSVGRQQWSIS